MWFKLRKIWGGILCFIGIHKPDKEFYHEDFVDREFDPCERCGRYIWFD